MSNILPLPIRTPNPLHIPSHGMIEMIMLAQQIEIFRAVMLWALESHMDYVSARYMRALGKSVVLEFASHLSKHEVGE